MAYWIGPNSNINPGHQGAYAKVCDRIGKSFRVLRDFGQRIYLFHNVGCIALADDCGADHWRLAGSAACS